MPQLAQSDKYGQSWQTLEPGTHPTWTLWRRLTGRAWRSRSLWCGCPPQPRKAVAQ